MAAALVTSATSLRSYDNSVAASELYFYFDQSGSTVPLKPGTQLPLYPEKAHYKFTLASAGSGGSASNLELWTVKVIAPYSDKLTAPYPPSFSAGSFLISRLKR